ncbi:APC family permease [Desulfobacca acetoxidans]
MSGIGQTNANDTTVVQGRLEKIGLPSATILVVANMVGTGIFTTSGFIIKDLQNPWAMLSCWVLGGLFALAGALCYGELGSRYPRAGGEYVFLRESFGELAGFLSGWISLLVGFSAPIAAASMAFAAYFLAGLNGGPTSEYIWTIRGIKVLTFSPLTLIASAVILAFTLIHRHSLSLGSRVQNVLTLFKISLIFGFVILGLFWGRGSLEHFGHPPDVRIFFSGEFAISLIFISFAYSGWNAAAYIGGEISRPAHNIPRALIFGTLLVAILYFFLNVTFLYGLPPHEMSGVLEVGEKAALALFGHRVSQIFSAAIALSLLSLISAMMLTGPRVYLAMAQDGLFFPSIGRLGTRRQTPGNAIALQATLAIILVLTASFEHLLLFIGFTLSVFAMLTVGGLMVLRHRQPRKDLPYQTLGYPLTAVVFILGNIWIILFTIFSRPMAALTGLGAVLAGLAVYAFFKWRRSPVTV